MVYNLGILISGNGSNMLKIIEASKKKLIKSKVVTVVSNNPRALGIKKASKKIFPIKFSDVHPHTKNLDTTKEKINLMETFWIGSGFTASKEKLLSLLS